MTHLRLLDAVIDNDIWEVVVTTNPNASGASQASTGHCGSSYVLDRQGLKVVHSVGFYPHLQDGP